MKTVAILSQKGGAGKTTLAIHLAIAAEKAGASAAIIDLDPQASAANWKNSREEDTPAVVSTQHGRLDSVLDAAKKGGATLTIIDTAPHSEAASLAAARAADFILIPCRPAILDLRAISNTIDLVRIAKKPAAVVLNSVPPRGSLAEDAAEAIAAYGMEIAPYQLTQRTAYTRALTGGQAAQEYEPKGKAAFELKKLYNWLCQQLDLSNGKKAEPRRRTSGRK